MAKGKIFIGEIMADQVSALSSMQSAMGIQTGKMDEMVTRLINLGESSAQAINTLKIESSILDENIKTVFPVAAIPETLLSATYTAIKSFKSLAEGSIAVKIVGKIRMQSSPATISLQAAYKKNGGTVVYGGTAIICNANQTKDFTFTFPGIPIAKDDLIEIGVGVNGTGGSQYFSYLADSCSIRYVLKDVVNGSAFVLQP